MAFKTDNRHAGELGASLATGKLVAGLGEVGCRAKNRPNHDATTTDRHAGRYTVGALVHFFFPLAFLEGYRQIQKKSQRSVILPFFKLTL
jgi:hypothetical protein